jgi:SagB-type dehydrogenase family enzyme
MEKFKMKRCINVAVGLIILLVGLSVVSLAQYEYPRRSRTSSTARSRSQASQLRTIQLSEPNLTGALSLESAFAQRRSTREFSSKKLTLSQIGQLAWAGQGITDPAAGLRTAPSAGALYPITLYIAIYDGLFVYRPQSHSLEQVLNVDIRGRLAAAASNQNAVAEAPCDIIVVGSVTKLMPRYQNQSRKYMLLEAGHVAQNILLQAVGLDLAGVPIGGFNASGVNNLFQMSRDMEPLYIISVGHRLTEARETPTIRQPKTERGQRAVENIDAFGPKLVVLITPSMNFNDAELIETQKALTDLGVATSIASTKRGIITGAFGRRSQADRLITNINLNEYHGVVFVGGVGISEYAMDPYVGQLINNAVSQGKIVGAISNATNILANAGVINGYRVTGTPGDQVFLERSGGQYTGSNVEKDGQIITAMNSQAASQFGNTVAESVKSVNDLFGDGERRIMYWGPQRYYPPPPGAVGEQ